MVENLVVFWYLLADMEPLLYAVLENIEQLIFVWMINVNVLYAPIESISIFVCFMYLKMKVHALIITLDL